MLICAHSQIPFCSNKCLHKCNRLNRLVSCPQLWESADSMLRKAPNLLANPLLLRKHRQKEFQTAGISLVHFLQDSDFCGGEMDEHHQHSTSFKIIQHHWTKMVSFIFTHSNRMRSGVVKVSALRPLHQHRSHRAIQKSLPYPRRGMFEPLKLQSFTEPTMAAKMQWVR